MPTRTRTRSRTHTGHYVLRAGQPIQAETRDIGRDTMTDIVGDPRNDHSLASTRVFVDGARHNEGPATLVAPSVSDCTCPGFYAHSPTPSFLTLPGTASAAWTRALSITNPSRPDILMPAFIAELKDFPRMVKYGLEVAAFLSNPQFRRTVTGWHRFSLKNVGNQGHLTGDPADLITFLRPTAGNFIDAAKQLSIANLAVQFGYLPFVSDIVKMFSFQEQVSKRKKELERLYSSSGLKRKVKLDSDFVVTRINNAIITTRSTSRTNIDVQRSVKRWVVVKWKPNGLLPLPPSDHDIRQMLQGFNLNSIGSVAWELLPWSWMSDYFGNIGQTLQASNNALQATPKGCVMTQSEELLQFPGYISGRVTVSSGRRKAIRKERSVHSGVSLPEFSIPILGTKQLSILGSMAVSRILK